MACRYQLRRNILDPRSAAAAEIVNLDKEVVKFGRNPEQVHIVLHSNLCPNMISREHAYIRQNRNPDGSISYHLFDTSLNGTYVNDIRVNQSILLHPGDTVKFGHVNGAAMVAGQLSLQADAEFAYIFEKVPRSTTAQVQTPTPSAQQVHAAAYDAAARRLAASPHAWPANPYAQLAAGPAAAYLAATGFSHPYLGHLPHGLLTPPPSAVAASALSTPSTCVAQGPAATGIHGMATGYGTYPGMVAGSSTTPLGSHHHSQQSQFRPSSAVVAAAAEAAAKAAWFGVNPQPLPTYQHPSTSAPQFALGTQFNPPSSSMATPSGSMVQQQQYQQQQDPNQNRFGAVNFANKKIAEMDALSSLSMLQKRQEFQFPQHQPTSIYSTNIPQQHTRTQQYSGTPQSNIIQGDISISNYLANAMRKLDSEQTGGDYVPTSQSRSDVQASYLDQLQRQQMDAGRKALRESPDCEILSPPEQSGNHSMSAQITSSPHIRESVVVDAQSVVRTYADTSGGVAALTTTAARMKQTAIVNPTSPTKELNVVTGQIMATQLSPVHAKAMAAIHADFQKAECDSSVPSPPEDPIRRKSTGTSSSIGIATDKIAPVDQHQSLNNDLLRLAADARLRCLDGSSQDDVFDLEANVDNIHRNDGGLEKTSSTSSSSSSSSSSSLSSGRPETENKPLFSPTSRTNVEITKTNQSALDKATPTAQRQQEQQSTNFNRQPKKKQRSNEVKRLFDDLQSSYLFNQAKKKARSGSSASSSSSEEEVKKKGNNSRSSSSSRSPVRGDSRNSKTKAGTKKKASNARNRRDSTSASSTSSESEDSSDETVSEDDGENRRRARTTNQGDKRTLARFVGRPNISSASTEKGNKGGKRSRGSAKTSSSKRGLATRRSAPLGSVSSSESGFETKKRRRTCGDKSSTSGGNKRTAAGRGRAHSRAKQQRLPEDNLSPTVRPEDAWKYHDPSQACAAGADCVKPNEEEIQWVECDDCERWFHISCVGCAYDEVKEEDTAFHCGCKP